MPRSAWWLPWLTLGGGAAVIAFTFWLMRWLIRVQGIRGQRDTWLQGLRGRVPRPPWRQRAEVPQPLRLRTEPAWPRSQWPRAAESRTAIPGPAGDAITEGK